MNHHLEALDGFQRELQGHEEEPRGHDQRGNALADPEEHDCLGIEPYGDEGPPRDDQEPADQRGKEIGERAAQLTRYRTEKSREKPYVEMPLSPAGKVGAEEPDPYDEVPGGEVSPGNARVDQLAKQHLGRRNADHERERADQQRGDKGGEPPVDEPHDFHSFAGCSLRKLCREFSTSSRNSCEYRFPTRSRLAFLPMVSNSA